MTVYQPGQGIHYKSRHVRYIGPRSLGANVLIYDTFTDADGTNLTAHAIAPINTPGAVWAAVDPVGSPIRVSSNRAVIGNGVPRYYLSSTVANCTVSATIRLVVAGNLGVMFRRTDDANYWVAFVQTTQIVLNEITGGVTTQRAATARAYSTGVDYVLSVVLAGNSISCTCDGTTITYTSAVRNTATIHGLRGSGNGNICDDFTVSA